MNFLIYRQKLIDEAIVKSKSYYEEFINMPFEFTKDEKIELDADKRKWPSDDKEMKDYWRKSIKYEKLNRYIEDLQQLEKKENSTDDSIRMDINKEVKT